MAAQRTKKGRGFLPALLLTLCLPLALSLFSRGLSRSVSKEELTMAKESVRQAAVECYALEGFYPADLSHLRTHYGLSVDEELYFIDYQYAGANLMPEITVFPLENQTPRKGA